MTCVKLHYELLRSNWFVIFLGMNMLTILFPVSNASHALQHTGHQRWDKHSMLNSTDVAIIHSYVSGTWNGVR